MLVVGTNARGWEADLDLETPASLRAHCHRCLLGGRDRPDDREPEADTVAGALDAEAFEGLEQTPDLLRRNRRAGVRHREDGPRPS
jgi:hypothetical protein